MLFRLHGVIRGKHIVLESETGLPDGSEVNVFIDTPVRSIDERRRLVDALCGTWSGDDQMAAIFDEIHRDRGSRAGRAIDFDVPS